MSDNEERVQEDTDEKCQGCGSESIVKTPVADGNADFKYTYECTSCGDTYE